MCRPGSGATSARGILKPKPICARGTHHAALMVLADTKGSAVQHTTPLVQYSAVSKFLTDVSQFSTQQSCAAQHNATFMRKPVSTTPAVSNSERGCKLTAGVSQRRYSSYRDSSGVFIRLIEIATLYHRRMADCLCERFSQSEVE